MHTLKISAVAFRTEMSRKASWKREFVPKDMSEKWGCAKYFSGRIPGLCVVEL